MTGCCQIKEEGVTKYTRPEKSACEGDGVIDGGLFVDNVRDEMIVSFNPKWWNCTDK